jgi:hypothetical protein
MRIAAAILLLIALVLDMLAGAVCLALGVMGADVLSGALSDTLSMMGDIAAGYASALQGQLERTVAEIMALEGRLDRIVTELEGRGGGLGSALDRLTDFGFSFGHGLAAAGALLMVAGTLALTAAIRLLRRRPGLMVYVGCVSAIIADAATFALLGFSYPQLPGLLGGLLGLLAAPGLGQRMVSKPAAKPVATAKPVAAPEPVASAGPRKNVRIRPTVITADDPRPAPDPSPGAFSRVAVPVSLAAVVIVGALLAYLAYDRYFAQKEARAPVRTASSTPTPAPAPGERQIRTTPKPAQASAAKIPSGPVAGQLAGRPFKPDRVALSVTTAWTTAGGRTLAARGTPKSEDFERLSLVLEAGEDFQIEIEGLPESYHLDAGLKLRVRKDLKVYGQPKLILRSPQSDSAVPNTDFVSEGYDLDLRLGPLKGNRINGRISLSLPESMKTHFAGTFKAWVDGHPQIEPDLTRGQGQTFKYIAFQYLREIHPGSEITIKDDTYSHQVGDASKLLRGHIMVVYTVDGEEAASMLRISTSEGYWRVVDSLDATYLAEAHPIEIPDPKNEGQWVNYLAALHTEEWFRQEHPGKYPWSVSFTGASNTDIGYADIQLSLTPYGESDAIDRRYYFLRTDGRWRYIRDLKDEEEIDRNTGKVVKKS